MQRRRGQSLRHAPVALAAAAFAACSAAPHAAVTPPPAMLTVATAAPPAKSPEAVGAAAIRFDAHGKPTRLPLVRATVAGVATSLLLDTGATTHALASWLTRASGLPVSRSETERAADHDGNVVAVTRADGVTVALDGLGPLAARSFVVLDLPAVFEQSDVGGILSPQDLAKPGYDVVVDFETETVRVERPGEARARLESDGGCALTPAPARRCAGEDRRERTGAIFAVAATIAGEDTLLALVTGAQVTDVFGATRAGSALRGRSVHAHDSATVLSGESEPSRTVSDVSVHVGACAFRRDVDVVAGRAGATCSREGVLGMDVLRSCRILFEEGTALATCRRDPAR